MAQPWLSLTPAQLQRLCDEGGPAVSPPPGVVSDFDHPTTLYPWILLTLVVGLTVSTLAVAVRLFTKWRLMNSIVFEDYLIILAWLTQFAQMVPSLMAMHFGLARHMWDMTMNRFLRATWYVPISCLTYGSVVMFIKVAILLQYLRIFVPVRQMNLFLYVGCWACIFATVIFYVITTVLDGVHFHSLTHGPSARDMQRYSQKTISSFEETGWFNIVSDFVVLLLPIPTICRLQIPLRKKSVVLGLFATGVLACVGSIVRIVYTMRMFKYVDASWDFSIMTLCTWAEYSIGILCYCLPVVPTFFRFFKVEVYIPITSRMKSGSQGSSGCSTSGSEKNLVQNGDIGSAAGFPFNSVSTVSSKTTQESQSQLPTPDPALWRDAIHHHPPHRTFDSVDDYV